MTSDLPHLPEFPNPPAFPAPRRPAEVLADFLHDLFESGVASVVDPLPLLAGQPWQAWAEAVLLPAAGDKPTAAEKKPAAAPTAPAARHAGGRPTLQQALNGAYRRLLLELPQAPGTRWVPPALQLPVAVEAARRLYQVCQVLAAPQQDKDELRKSFTADFRPANTGALLSVYATWRYLPMLWDHVRQRLTIATGATLAMQEIERLIRDQVAMWPWPLRPVLAMDVTPEAASLAILERDPVAQRYLAEQLLTQAALAPSPRLAAWLGESTPAVMQDLLGGLSIERLREPLIRSFGEAGERLVRQWGAWLARVEQ